MTHLHRRLRGIACLVVPLVVLGGQGIALGGPMDRHRTGDGVAIGDNSPSEALGFARKVMKRIDRVREHSVREVSGRELVSWAVEGLYQAQGGKAPLAVRERLSAVRDIPNEELVELLRDARAGLGRPPDLADDQDLDRAIGHMLFRLDPHGGLVRLPHRIGCFRDTAGIGVRLAGDASKKWPRVVTPIKDGPAYQAGIKAGDVITHITLLDRDEVFLTENLPLDRVEQLLTGRAEVKVRLTVRREGEKRPRELEMARCWVEEETVLGSRRKADDSWDYWLDREERVGYVRLTRFGRDTAGQLTQVVGELTRQGLKGLILDLRSNPGGLLKSATEVADLFINDGDIVTIQPRTGLPYGFRGRPEGSHLSFPMACLINGASASGSEVVAACLQDHRRASIIGERSQGKGSVQILLPLDDHQLKLTIAVFLRPLGRKLDRIQLPGRDEEEWGVAPDLGHELKLPPAERAELLAHLDRMDVIPRREGPVKDHPPAFRDRQREWAVEHLRAQIRKG